MIAVTALADLQSADPNDSIELVLQASNGPPRSFGFVASVSGDTVEFTLDGETYSASIPHTEPVQPITLLPATDEEYRLVIPPTTMTSTSGGMRTIGLDLTLPIGFLALPCE